MTEVVPNEVFPKLSLFSTKGVALVIILIALMVAGGSISATIPIIPGAVGLKPTTFLEPMAAMLFGPVIGFVASLLSWYMWALVGGYLNIGFIANTQFWSFLVAAMPGICLRNIKDWREVTFWAVIWQFPAAFVAGAIYDFLGIAPLMVIFTAILIADIPGTLVGTPIAVKYLYPRLKKMGLIWPRWYKLKD
jgi:hypothetical protein